MFWYMQRYLGVLALGLVLSCGPSQDDKITALERKIERLTEQQTEEHTFIDNLALLRTYAGFPLNEEHPSPPSCEQTLCDHVQDHYGDFTSWSKRTLDNLSSFFVHDRRGGYE
jgi:succinylglutamate desuccinylase